MIEIICILDRSGSMSVIKWDAIGGFNQFLSDQKKGTGEASITLVQFNHKYEVTYSAAPLSEAPELCGETFIPIGTTALLDAIGTTINSVGQRLDAMAEANKPEKVIVAILTDGKENESTEFTRKDVNEMINHQRDKYNWEFIFLAANQDAIKEGAKLGVDCKDAYNFVANSVGTQDAFTQMSESVTNYRKVKKY